MRIHRHRYSAIALLALVPGFVHAGGAEAAEIKVWTARAIATVLAEVGPEFERATGHQVSIASDLGTTFVRRARQGEPFDVMITGATSLALSIEDGKVAAATRTPIARSGIGVAVCAGAPRPDISTVDAFKRTLMDAKSIAYLKDVGSGLYVAQLLDRLGIAAVVNEKATRPETDIVSELVANGQADLGIVVITQILTTPGVDLLGPLPPEVQSYVPFAAGIGSQAREPGAARELIHFLKGPTARRVIAAQGMEPDDHVSP